MGPRLRGDDAEHKPPWSYFFVIRSISAISSAVSFQPMALAFCSTCSALEAPAITLETCGRAAS